jgi:hypothetical protein
MSEQPSESEPSPGQEEPSSKPEPKAKSKPAQKKGPSDAWNSLEKFVIIIGTWAWLIGLISGIILVLSGIAGLVASQLGSYLWLGFGYGTGTNIWNIIGGAINIIISLAIVLPRFSMKCKNEDWDFLYNDVLVLGNFRFPLMLLWGGLLTVFSYWGGAGVLFSAFVLLFAGPKTYEWFTE